MEIQSILKPLIPSVSSTQLPLEWNILKLPSYYRQQANGEMYVEAKHQWIYNIEVITWET